MINWKINKMLFKADNPIEIEDCQRMARVRADRRLDVLIA